MTDEICTSLSEHGFAVVRGVLADHDFAPLEAEFAMLLEERTRRWQNRGQFHGPRITVTDIRQGILDLAAVPNFDLGLLAECDITLPHQPFAVIQADSPFHVGPALLELVRWPALLDVIERVVGPDITLSSNGHARYKLPDSGGAGCTPWHRDAMTHVPASDPVSVLTCWVPMDDVTLDNGCLVVEPGGHRTHRDLRWPLTPAVVSELDDLAVPIPVDKGDVVLLHKDVPHASRPNRSKTVRWSFDLRYHPSSGPSDRPWFPSLDLRRCGRPVRADGREWQRRWELTRAVFASAGRLVPGRAEYARAIAEEHIGRWADCEWR